MDNKEDREDVKLTKKILTDYEIIQFNNGKYALKRKTKYPPTYINIRELKKGIIKEWWLFWENYCVADSVSEIKRAIKDGFNTIKVKEEKEIKYKSDWMINKKINVPLTDIQEIKFLKETNVEKDKVIESILKELDSVSTIKTQNYCNSCVNYNSPNQYCTYYSDFYTPDSKPNCPTFIKKVVKKKTFKKIVISIFKWLFGN